MEQNTYAVIMAGGIGSRFWPVSREKRPKQFIDILGIGKTLIQLTYDRLKKTCPAENIFIVTNDSYKQLVMEQLPEVKDDQVLCEPLRRNTGPCIAYAAHKIASKDPNAVMIVAPSDHLIVQEDKFSGIIKKAADFADKNDALITLGMRPTRPDTGYGYIQYMENPVSHDVFKVKTFTEKPTLEIAKTFLKSGDFLWNSGIFIWSISSILKAFEKVLPEVNDIFKAGKKFYNTDKEQEFINKAYSLCTNISIDFGVMEKSENVFVIPADFGWSDLGTWASLHEQHEKDYLGNAVTGKNVMIYDASNCMVVVPDNKLVILQGLEDFIVVDNEDVLLICQKSKEQEIKEITADIKRSKGEQYL